MHEKYMLQAPRITACCALWVGIWRCSSQSQQPRVPSFLGIYECAHACVPSAHFYPNVASLRPLNSVSSATPTWTFGLLGDNTATMAQ
eukprot:5784709-Amphidinium_carterae.1